MNTPRTALLERGRQRWCALLFGVVLAVHSFTVRAGPDDAPEGFVREDLKDMHASISRPKEWFFRRLALGIPYYEIASQPFDRKLGIVKGMAIYVQPKAEGTADERAAKMIADCTTRYRVLRAWTRKNTPAEPFTTYGLVCVMQGEETDGLRFTCELVIITNRVTNTVYQCWLAAPPEEWKDVEQAGERIIASLRLDPKF